MNTESEVYGKKMTSYEKLNDTHELIEKIEEPNNLSQNATELDALLKEECSQILYNVFQDLIDNMPRRIKTTQY
ncbi:9256_t:CDS:2 [Entrophospora sp. SA101]|nr:9256_t:CDS:2 [Entrophospora sp. SA101]